VICYVFCSFYCYDLVCKFNRQLFVSIHADKWYAKYCAFLDILNVTASMLLQVYLMIEKRLLVVET